MNAIVNLNPITVTVLIWAAAYLLAITSSGAVVRLLFRLAKVDTARDHERTGTIIGKIEDVLVITFVAADAFTGLALIFAAKNLSRIDHHKQKEVDYYFLGTLANFTWALLVGLAAKLTLLFLGISLPLAGVAQIN